MFFFFGWRLAKINGRENSILAKSRKLMDAKINGFTVFEKEHNRLKETEDRKFAWVLLRIVEGRVWKGEGVGH